jgi:preprotein translocase subunit SecE
MIMTEAVKQTKKSPGFSRITKYVKEVRAELKKVVWPTWKQVRNNTAVVIAAIVVVGLIIWAVDVLFGGVIMNFLM